MRAKGQKFKSPRVIYCDVDNTLVVGGRLNKRLVQGLGERRPAGFQLNVWSARGEEVARAAVERAELEGKVNACLSKPGTLVDDAGWGWVRFTHVINPMKIQS